jgi:hypothetical protein
LLRTTGSDSGWAPPSNEAEKSIIVQRDTQGIVEKGGPRRDGIVNLDIDLAWTWPEDAATPGPFIDIASERPLGLTRADDLVTLPARPPETLPFVGKPCSVRILHSERL